VNNHISMFTWLTMTDQ